MTRLHVVTVAATSGEWAVTARYPGWLCVERKGFAKWVPEGTCTFVPSCEIHGRRLNARCVLCSKARGVTT